MMGKRSDFPRNKRDFYTTPESALKALVPCLRPGTVFYEPCCGDGRLIRHLEKYDMKCAGASDIETDYLEGSRIDALGAGLLRIIKATDARKIITNTPWPRRAGRGEPAMSFIHQFAGIMPSWMLFPADMMHNVYFSEVKPMCAKIVTVGRVSWMDNGVSGLDNAAWYLFDIEHDGPTEFLGRAQ
jgi:hypothetical protein